MIIKLNVNIQFFVVSVSFFHFKKTAGPDQSILITSSKLGIYFHVIMSQFFSERINFEPLSRLENDFIWISTVVMGTRNI